MNEAEHDDDYLWNRGGPVDPELAMIERELCTLAWRPRPLPLPLPLPIAAHEAVPRMPVRRTAELSRSRSWPALIAGLAMAATVLGAVYLSRDESDVSRPANDPLPAIEMINPASQPPHSPDVSEPEAGELRDPFGSSREQTPTAPTHSDLKDPFLDPDGSTRTISGKAARPSNEPAQVPAAVAPEGSPDLKDPFGRDEGQSQQSEPVPILDPFGGEPSKDNSSDLKDPFGKQH